MEKNRKGYIKPSIKVNDFISRNYLLGWEIGQGTTDQQLGHDPGPDDLELPGFQTKGNNVWNDE